jgi:hypothetical protein
MKQKRTNTYQQKRDRVIRRETLLEISGEFNENHVFETVQAIVREDLPTEHGYAKGRGEFNIEVTLRLDEKVRKHLDGMDFIECGTAGTKKCPKPGTKFTYCAVAEHAKRSCQYYTPLDPLRPWLLGCTMWAKSFLKKDMQK